MNSIILPCHLPARQPCHIWRKLKSAVVFQSYEARMSEWSLFLHTVWLTCFRCLPHPSGVPVLSESPKREWRGVRRRRGKS
jgi:hypothetical protein